MGEINRKNEVTKIMAETEFYPVLVDESVNLLNYTKISLTSLLAMGTGLESVVTAFQGLGKKGGSGLYMVKVPPGRELAEFRDKTGYLGSVLTETGAVGGGQAVLTPLICNPTTLFMAGTLVNIDIKLDAIIETQEDILNLLIQKEKSELRGDLNFLFDVLNNYKYNWDNEKFKNNNHIKVLDIKQSSEQKIDFYREQIMSKINKRSILQMDQEIKKQLDKLQPVFKEYQLAVYLYSFSAFLETLLLENFDSEYLGEIISKIQNYSYRYRELYTECYDLIEGSSESSIQSRLLKGAASLSSVVGKTVSRVPVINKSQFDGTLLKVRDKLEQFNSKRTEQTLEQFTDKQISYVVPFIENINTIKNLHNNTTEILYDGESIYFEVVGE